MISRKNISVVNGLYDKTIAWELCTYGIRCMVSKCHNHVGCKCRQFIVKGFVEQDFELSFVTIHEGVTCVEFSAICKIDTSLAFFQKPFYKAAQRVVLTADASIVSTVESEWRG